VLKPGKISRAGGAGMRNTELQSENLTGEERFGDLDVDGMILLKLC
jgi:hypothetical protein